jgi:hypothetical protein
VIAQFFHVVFETLTQAFVLLTQTLTQAIGQRSNLESTNFSVFTFALACHFIFTIKNKKKE